MAVISVQSPTTGVTYSVQIGGDAPTPTEQERINQYIAQQDAAVQGMMGGGQSAPDGQGGFGNAVGLGIDVLQSQAGSALEGLGASTGFDFLRDFGAGVVESNAPQIEQRSSGIRRYEDVAGFSDALAYLRDEIGQQVPVMGAAMAGSYAGSRAVAPIAAAVPHPAAKAAITGAGALIGGAVSMFPLLYGGNRERQKEADIEAGREVEVDEGAAALYAIPQAAGEAILGSLVVSRLLPESFITRGGLLTRVVKGGISGGVVEVPTEIGQQVLERMQAGLPIDSDEAIAEYVSAGRSAMIAGGALGGGAGALSRDSRKVEEERRRAVGDEQIDADILEDQPEILDQISRGIAAEGGTPQQPSPADTAERFRAFVPQKALGLPAPQAGSLAAIAGTGQPNITPTQTPATGQAIGAEVPSVEVSPFRWSQYEAAKQSIIESGDATVPNIARAASSAGQPVTPAVAKKIRSQLEQDGVITADPKAKGKYRSTPESVKPVAMDESLRRSISDVTRDLEEARAARAKAEQDARRSGESGKKAEAAVASRALSAADSMVKTSETTLNDLTARLAQAPAASTVPTTERPASRRVGMQAVIPAAQEPTVAAGAVSAQADTQTKEGRDAAVAARAGRLTQAAENYTAQAQQKIAAASSIEAQGRKVQLPKSEVDRIASLRAEAARDMDAAKKLRSAAERASSDVQKMRERQAAEAARQVAATAAKSNRTPEYDARQAQLTNAMRQRLDGLGLKDVDVRGAPILEIEDARKGVLVEGMFDVEDGKRVISLSMGIYEPGAPEADTLKKIAAVVDHEVIHALRNLGVIKDAEWKSLSSLAARQKYMREKDGKTVERQYTYLQRAQRMNADADPEIQVEEAVAEMYRDFAAGRLKIGGRPRSVMERIRDFFRAIIRSHKDVGITDPAAMFEAIKSGQVGARERAAVDAEGDAARMSRAPVDGKKDMRRFSARTTQGIDRDGRDEDVGAAGPSVPASGAGAGRSVAEAAAEKFAARAQDGSPEYGQLTPSDLDNISPEFFSRPGWAILTATRNDLNPRFAADQNARSHEQLKADFARLGIPYREVMGVYKGEPDGISYIILADEPTATRLGATFGQESILTNRGLVYTSPLPRVALTGEAYYGEEALQQDFYSQMGDEAFSLGLDWSTGPTSPDIGPGYFERDDKPQLPIRRSDGMVELHHWSNTPLTAVDPAFAGTGPLKGTERVRGVKYGYFGINPRPSARAQGTGYVKESGLGSFEHVAIVDPDTLYPYYTDPDGLFSGIDRSAPDAQTQYERKIRDAGYAGYYTERLSLSGAPQGNAAAMFDIVPVRPVTEVQLGLRNPTRYSRRSTASSPLTEADKRLTVINRMDQETGAFISDGKRRSVMDVITELFEPRRDVVINPRDAGAAEKMAQLMLAETRMALLRNPEAIGWYGEKLAQSKRVAAILHPEISPVNPFSGAKSNIYDPLAEHAWDLAMAITSNGMAVTENAKYANAQYENWRDTGFFIEEGVGDQGSGMKAAFRLYNTMKRSMSEEQIMDFLAQKMTVGQLKKSPVVKAVGINIGSSESVNTEINGSYIFGPKIGQGFFQNLRGNFDPLTMDLWFMRLFNRISGRPFAEVSDKTIRDNTERLIKAANSDTATEYERSVLNSAMKANDIDVITPENSGDLAVTINNMYQRDFRLSYNRAIKESGLDKKSPEAKAIGKEARPKKTELFLAAQRFSDNLELTPQDAPRGSADRTFMRDVVDRVRMALADDGVDITTADIQAVLWYAEKQLYASMGVTGGKGADNDYVDGAIELLRSKGIDDAETIRALSDADRVRLYRRTASARSAGGVRGGGDTADGQVEDGGGSGGVSGEAVRGGSEEAVVDGDKGRLKRKYSRRSTAGAMSPKTQKKVQANQSALMYARSADTIAKGLQLGGYGLDERRARQFVDGVLRRFQDSMLPVGRMIQELSAKGMNIVDAMDTYLQEEIMSRKTGALIEKNTKDLYEPMVALVKKLNVPAQRIEQLKRASTSAAGQKGFVERAIEQYGSSKMALAEAYLYARHAKERNRYILENKDDQNTKGSGMSDAEADAILRWFEALDPANKKVVADIGKYARLIVANTNQTRVDGGLISRDVVNAEEGDANQGTSYGFYVPLRGIINEDLASVDDAQYMPPATPRYGARGKEDRTALGRAEYASDILANLMTQNQNAIVRAERNKVGQSFLRLLRADQTMTDEYARILPTPPKIRDTVNGKIVMRTDPNAYKRPEILVVKEDGKETFVQFDDLSLAGAMNGQNGFGPETGGALLRGMSMVNRYLASINTSYNPAFVITNVFRDIMTGLVNLNQFEIEGLSSEVAKNILPSIKGIAGAVLRGDTTSPWAKVYADFVESGGQNATNSFDTLEERVNDLRGLLSEISDAGSKSQWSRMKNSFVGQKGASLLNTVESINTAAENGIRVATYKALLDRGFTKERAAQAAGNVTVNFSKGGDYRRLLNGVFLFYNASIQGTFAMLNAATRSKKVQALWVGIMAAGLVNDMFNAMMFGEDDDGELIYDKIPQYILQNNIILPDLLGTGDRSYISIPMPYGLNMAYNTGRSVSRFMRGNYSAAEATSSIFGTAVDVLNPIGSGDTFLDPNTVSPTILDPVVDLLSNEDFSGKPIYKEALGFDRTPDPASQRYWSTTSPSAVWIAKNLNSLLGGNEVRPGPLDMSPDVIQFWFEFLTGGVGRFVQQSGESIASVGTGNFGEDFIENFPVFNRVVRTVSEREDMGSYIEGAERVLTAEAELKRAREVGDQQWAQRTIQRYGAELRVVGQIRSAETALRRLSRQRGEIESNARIPEAQKVMMLDRIEERRQQVLARANAILSSLD